MATVRNQYTQAPFKNADISIYNMGMIVSFLKQKHLRRHIFFAWLTAAVFTGTIIFATGGIYGAAEAREIAKAVQSSSLYYGAAVITASATILALMITLLSLTYSSDEDFEKETFENLKVIAYLCVISFIAAVALMFIISFPVSDLDKIKDEWTIYYFYGITFWNGILAGYMISVILILKNIAFAMIERFAPDLD